jgi:protein SCO1/2
MTPRPFSPKRRVMAIALALSGLTALAGCDSGKKLPFKGTDITGTNLGSGMAMVDSTGKVRTLADYKGKVVVVYFGYTHCPDVCPTSMASLAQVMALLKGDAKKVQVIMITVDPARDTPAVMNRYAKAFYPTFIGLSGTPQQLEKTAKSFKAYYAKEAGKTPDTYTMNHGSSFYIFDTSGQARVLIGSNAAPQAVADDIKLLL